jgi:LDH2 family malate/lactate/ureidoglycolate dehydrogenase
VNDPTITAADPARPRDPRFSADEVHRQCAAILRAWGFTEDAARTTADVMTHTDLSGIDSHGISMFINYETAFAQGRLNTAAEPSIVRENAGTAVIDAQRGLGHPAAVAGMDLAVEKAMAFGVGVVSVFNSHHFGAAGYYTALAARRGYAAIAMTSARTTAVVPTGGGEPRLSTNPLSFAAPGRNHEPFLLDMSTSTVAINKIKTYDLSGRRLPEGWFLDRDGRPVTDAGVALQAAWAGTGGGLTPLGGARETGGHKGYGLSMMVQILSCALSGGSLSATRGDGDPDNIGHFFLALDPAVFRPDGGFRDDVDHLVDAMHATVPAGPDAEVLVAGEPEARARADREKHGIPLPGTLLVRLAEICARTGAPFLLHDHR